MPHNRILIVDDDSAPREALALVFEEQYEVTLVESGAHAIDVLQKQSFAGAIIDVCMKGLSGLDTLRALRQLNPNTQTIILTGFKSRETVLGALSLGASNCLFKPFEIGLLEATVAQCCARFRFLSCQDLEANCEAHKLRNSFLRDLRTNLEAPYVSSDLPGKGPPVVACQTVESACENICKHYGHRLLESINAILEYSHFFTENVCSTYRSFGPAALVGDCLRNSGYENPDDLVSVGDGVPHQVVGPAYELQTLLGKWITCMRPAFDVAPLRVGLGVSSSDAENMELCFRLTSETSFFDAPRMSDVDKGQDFDLGLSLCEHICEKIGARFTIEEDTRHLTLFARVGCTL